MLTGSSTKKNLQMLHLGTENGIIHFNSFHLQKLSLGFKIPRQFLHLKRMKLKTYLTSTG